MHRQRLLCTAPQHTRVKNGQFVAQHRVFVFVVSVGMPNCQGHPTSLPSHHQRKHCVQLQCVQLSVCGCQFYRAKGLCCCIDNARASCADQFCRAAQQSMHIGSCCAKPRDHDNCRNCISTGWWATNDTLGHYFARRHQSFAHFSSACNTFINAG